MPPHTQSPTHPRFAHRDGAPPAFRCARSPGGLGPASVHLRGELDLATAPQLERTLREAQLDASLVVLDLRELDFMDCAGLHVIVDAAERARRDGCRLIVVRGPARVDRLFTLTGTADVIEISDHDPRQPPMNGRPDLSELDPESTPDQGSPRTRRSASSMPRISSSVR